MNKLNTGSFGVLIAEDLASDRFLLNSAISATATLRTLAEVADGHGVVSYFQGEDKFSDRSRYPLPRLLLLDLKMPRMDGFAVLEWLGTQHFEDLTTVVLTDSIDTEHLKRALDLGADFFQLKPRSLPELYSIVQGLERYVVGAVSAAGPTPSRLVHARERVNRPLTS